MEQPAPAFPFRYRPMVAAVLSAGAGIYFSGILTGIWPVAALCLFSILGFICWYKGILPQRTFALALVFSLLRCLLLPELSLPGGLLRPFEDAREVLVSSTRGLFPGPEGPLLCAMLWGGKEGLDPSIYAAFRGAGIAHVLALSGLHVSFITMALNRLAKAMERKLRFVLTAALLFAYCAVAAFPASLVRAALMCLIPMLADLLCRKKDPASSIALAALCILACEPSALYDVGFQLSFGAVCAIAMLSKPLAKRLSFPRSISETVSVSICGTLGTLPLTAYYFGEISVLSIFANLLILPIVPIAFLSSMLTSLAGVAYVPLGEFLAPFARLSVRIMSAAAQAVSALPFALVESPKPGFLSCALFFGAMLMASRFCMLPQRRKWAYSAALFAAALLPML